MAYENKFMSFSLEPLEVLDDKFPKSVKVLVLDKNGDWNPRTLSTDHIWDIEQTTQYIETRKAQIEKTFLEDMSSIVKREKFVNTVMAND